MIIIIITVINIITIIIILSLLICRKPRIIIKKVVHKENQNIIFSSDNQFKRPKEII